MEPTVFSIPPLTDNSNIDNYNEELNQTLRQIWSPDGTQLPLLTAAQVTLVAPEANDGVVWFNTTLGLPQVAIGGVAKTFTVT